MLDWQLCHAVEWFPGVTRDQVLEVLRFAELSLSVA